LENEFIGNINNTNAPEIPIGFGMMLEGDPTAKETYQRMTNEEKERLVHYMQQAKSGKDSEYRVANALKILKENETEKFS